MSDTLHYITDANGRRTAVVLPIVEYEKMLEDLDDLAAIAERREDPTVSHEEMKAEFERDGLL